MQHPPMNITVLTNLEDEDPKSLDVVVDQVDRFKRLIDFRPAP